MDPPAERPVFADPDAESALRPGAGYPSAPTVAPPQPPVSRGQSVARAFVPQHRVEIVTAVGLVIVLGALGLAVGPFWEWISPRVTYTVVQKGQAALNDEISEAAFAADAWFTVLGLIVGVVAGIATWFVRRARGPLVLLLLGGAALLGSWVAWRAGVWVGRHPTPAETGKIFNQVGATLRKPLAIRTKVALLAEPAAAVIAYLCCLGLSSWGLLGGGGDDGWRWRRRNRDRVR